MTNMFDSLVARGLVKDVSGIESLRVAMGDRRVAVYAGFDATADGLHAGHLVTLFMLRDFHKAGYMVIPIIGDETARVGDPTGRSSARPMLDESQLRLNVAGLARDITGIVEVVPVVNSFWLGSLRMTDFLRVVGSRVSMGRLNGLDAVRSRENGCSLMEACYPLLQAFDFMELRRQHGPLLQIGGSDQWGNICMGLDLCASKAVDGVWGMTHPLLVDSLGRKMGKSSGRPVWLSANKLSDLEFFQYWRTLPDADVHAVARMLDVPLPGGDIERDKAELALVVTAHVRGMTAALTAERASAARGRSADGMNVQPLPRTEVRDIHDVMVLTRLASSRSASRRLMEQGGLYLNGDQVSSDAIPAELAQFQVSAGKTRHAAVRMT